MSTRLIEARCREQPMQAFIPLEDDWSLLEAIAERQLVPYQVGMPCLHRASPVSGTDDRDCAADHIE